MRPRKFVRSTALVLVLTAALTVTAFAADPTQRPANETDNKSSYYPTSVEMTEDDAGNPMIRKTYQLSVSDDPQKLPVADFERDGRRYYLLDMTKEDKIGVDTKEHSETVKLSSDTKEMEQILQRLDAQKEVTTEDGHTGVLTLDHTSVKVTADGYGTKKRTLSATRTYPNLSDADVALIPKTIQDNGHTLTLADVRWDSAYQTEADEAVVRYCATAQYTGESSSQYVTGYPVTIDGKEYLQQVFTADSETWVCDYDIDIGFTMPDEVPEGTRIVDMNNNDITKIRTSPNGASYAGQFKVLYPKDSVSDQTGAVQMSLHANVYKYAIYYALCAETSKYGTLQRYMCDTDPTVVTGTYNRPGTYKIVYRVNGGGHRTLADNLSTQKNYTLAASATALKLASNERVTEIMFVFGQAPAGFAQVEKPYLHCKAVTGLSAGSFVNVADVGGTYGGTWVQGISRWVTTVYGKPVIPTLPKTGY